jgi:hypothetical protein
MKLPKAEQNLGEWQAAIECLVLVAEKNGPTMMVRIGMMKAPCRGRVRGAARSRHRLDEPRHRLMRPRPGAQRIDGRTIDVDHDHLQGCLSNKTALAMVFKLLEAAQKSWRRLDGQLLIENPMQGQPRGQLRNKKGSPIVRSGADRERLVER